MCAACWQPMLSIWVNYFIYKFIVSFVSNYLVDDSYNVFKNFLLEIIVRSSFTFRLSYHFVFNNSQTYIFGQNSQYLLFYKITGVHACEKYSRWVVSPSKSVRLWETNCNFTALRPRVPLLCQTLPTSVWYYLSLPYIRKDKTCSPFHRHNIWLRFIPFEIWSYETKQCPRSNKNEF